MICPKCESDNLEVKTEAAYLAYTTHKIVDGRVKGFKKSELNKPPLFEIRVFIKCADCDYETNNANHQHNSDFDKDFVESIVSQMIDLISEPKKKRVTNNEEKYKKFFESKPTPEDVISYIEKNKNRSNFDSALFHNHVKEFLARFK